MNQNKTTPPTLLYSLIAIMVLLWSGNYIVAKVALREIPPVLLMSLRMAVSGVLILPFLVAELRSKKLSPTRRELGIWTALGLGGVMLNQFTFVLGISRTTVTHSSMLIATGPVWVLLAAALLKMERVTVVKILGISTAIAGVAILQIFRSKPTANGPTVAGDLLILLTAILFALMTVFSKRLRSKQSQPSSSAIVINSIGYIGGAFLLAPFGYLTSPNFDFSTVSWAGWGGLLYMGAFSSVLCYLIYYWVLERMQASRIATYIYFQPFVATLLAVAILHEELTVPAMASGAVIFTGVFLTERFG